MVGCVELQSYFRDCSGSIPLNRVVPASTVAVAVVSDFMAQLLCWRAAAPVAGAGQGRGNCVTLGLIGRGPIPAPQRRGQRFSWTARDSIE